MSITIMWIIIAILAVVIDAITSSFFFCIFSVGGFIAAICNALGMPFLYQIMVFAIISIFLISFIYPVLKKKFKADIKKTPLMEEKYIGMIKVAQDDIERSAQIKVGGEYWTVVNYGETIHKGQEFKIVGIEGIKLKIQKN